MKPKLSIVTGTMNRREGFWRLLDSVIKHTPESIPWEMVVSDATDEDKIYTHDLPPNITVIPERPRQTCVIGYNNAFKIVKGDWVIWLNDDATVMPGYAEAAIHFMENNTAVGLGALYYCETVPPFHINEYWGMVYANFGIISRLLGEHVGWFDKDLTIYGCDNSLAFRVLLAGKGIGSIPDARVWHHTVADQAKIDNQQHRKPAVATLEEKYGSRREDMWGVYAKTAHLAGPLVIGE